MQNRPPTIALLLALAAAVIGDSDDNKDAPPFDADAFSGCAKNDAEKYHSYYVCRDDHKDKLTKLGENFFRQLDAFEKCYALAAAKKLKMQEPHSIEAFEKQYGLVEILLRSYKCKSPNGPDDPSIITNTQKLELIKTTAWAFCQAQLPEQQFKDMKAFYVCREYPKALMIEYFNYIYVDHEKAKPFETCFVEAAAEALELTTVQFTKKYDIAMLVKSLKCSRVPEHAKTTQWTTRLSWLVEISNGAFTKMAAAAKTFLADKTQCLQKEAPPETATIGGIACFTDKLAKVMGCLGDTTKQAASPAPNDIARKQQESRLTKAVETISKVFRKLNELICGKGTPSNGQSGKGAAVIHGTKIHDLGNLLLGKAREKRSNGSPQDRRRTKRGQPDDAFYLGMFLFIIGFSLFVLAPTAIVSILLATYPHAVPWFMAIWGILNVFIISS